LSAAHAAAKLPTYGRRAYFCRVILKVRRYCFGGLLVGIWITQLSAQSVKYANAWLDIGTHARALGNGNAAVSTSQDVSAAYWNPAGLAFMAEKVQLSLMHNEHFGGIVKFDYGGLGLRLGENGAGALSVLRQGVDNIPNTLELIDKDGQIRYDRLTSFSVADYAFLASYAHRLPVEGLSLGGSAKVLHRSIGPFGSGWGIGLDLGLRYVREGLRCGLALRDISTTHMYFTYNTEVFREIFTLTGNEVIARSSEMALPKIIPSVAYSVGIGHEKPVHITPAVDIVLTTDGRRNTLISADPVSLDLNLGLEADYKNVVFIRGGAGRFQRVQETPEKQSWIIRPSVGMGIRIKTVSVDYALTNFAQQGNGLFSHVVSLTLGFKAVDEAGKSAPQRRKSDFRPPRNR